MSRDLHKKFFNSRLSAGWVHTLLASDDGHFYGFGVSRDGELGHGVGFTEFQASQLNFNIPSISKPELVQVAVGARHSLILADGNVYSSGAPDDGRLGHHLVHGQIKFPNVDKIAYIACGADGSIAISEDGRTLYVWGRGYTSASNPEPVAIRLLDPATRSPFTSKIVSAACGTEHALALCQDGTVWSWGKGRNGRLGHGNETECTVPTIIKSLIVSEDQKIVQIACGDSHNLALSAEGRVFAWGSGAYGRLGLGTEMDVQTPTMIEGQFRDVRVIAVTCNSFHSAALALPDNDDYSLYTWGGGKYGKLGHADTLNRLHPTAVQFFKKPQRAIRVACGQHHTVAISMDNRIFAWGCATSMRCGFQHDTSTIQAPMRLDYFDDKRVCSLASDMKTIEVKQEDYKCKRVAVGERHSVALAVESGRNVILAWGNNTLGQMGVGKMAQSSRPIPVSLPAPMNTVIVQVVCGGNFSMCLSDMGTIYAWGDNAKGQLGLGDTTNRYKPEVVKALQGTNIHAIVAGWAHTAAIANSGDASRGDDVYVWGDHQYGQLGIGTEAEPGMYPCYPALCTFPKSLPIPSTVTAKQGQRERISLALGTTHTVILVERYETGSKKVLESRVYTCGMGAQGQLGSYANTQWTYATPQLVTEWNLSPEDEKFLRETSRQIKAPVDSKGKQLKLPRIHLIAASETASIAVSNPSDIEVVYAWGHLPGLYDDARTTPTHIQKLANAEELKQELGSDLPINDFRIIKVITAKSHHMLMCKYNEKANHGRAPIVFGWGETKYGKLGVGNVAKHMAMKLQESHQRQQGATDNAVQNEQKEEENGEFTTVLGPELLKNFRTLRITGVSSLCDHSALVTDEGEVYVWGYGEGGRLGLGDGRSSNNKSESEPVVIPLFHKAERQLARVNKRRQKQQQETKQQHSDIEGTEAADLARKTRILRVEFTKAFKVHRSQYMKARLEQIELIHTAILKRVDESQGDVNSLTSRHRIRMANRERRLLRLRKLKVDQTDENGSQSTKTEEKVIELTTPAAMSVPVTMNTDAQPHVNRKEKPLDKHDSGSCVCCCFGGRDDWDMDVDVESEDDEAGQDMDGYLEEKAMEQKVSFERDLLNASETLITRLYMQPCLMFRAYQLYANNVNAVLHSADAAPKSRKKQLTQGEMNDENEKNKSVQIVEKANNLRDRFCLLVFNIYDLHRDEDIRVFHVFLRLTLEFCTRGKTKQNILIEESVEWQLFRDVFLNGRIRRQLADLLAKALAEVTPFTPSNDRTIACSTPVDWLEKYLEDKTTESVSEAFRLIRRKADELMTLLESEQYLAPMLSIIQWPLVILCSVLRRNKINPREVVGRVAMKVIAEVLLADQTYQFERKRRQLQRKGFNIDDGKGADMMMVMDGEMVGGKRWSTKNAITSAISSGASQLGPSETLILLQLKDVGSELTRDDVTDLILYVTGRYKIPDYVMKKISYTDNMRQDENSVSIYSHNLVTSIIDVIEDAEAHESKGESSTYKQMQLDLLTHFLRMPFFFPRRIAQMPRAALHLLCNNDFCSSQDRKKVLKELSLLNKHPADRDKDFARINLRLDPTRCDFDLRRKSSDDSCDICKCMHPRPNANAHSHGRHNYFDEGDTQKDKDIVLSFTKIECDLMFDILCEPNFGTVIEELNGESCWQAIMAELKSWRERRIDLYSEQEGGHDYEIASYAFKRLLKLNKGTKVELGEKYDLVSFVVDSTCVEPALLREKLIERDIKKRQHTDEEQRKVAALDSLKRMMDQELRQEPQLITRMSQDFVNLTSKSDIDLAYLDKYFHLNSKNTDQRTLRKFADKLHKWSKTHVVRERGKMVIFKYDELVSRNILYRVKPLRKYLPCWAFCCLRMWSCCHCTQPEEQKLVSFLSKLSFVMITSADPDIVNLKIIYQNKLSSTNVIIVKSVLISLRALTTEDCSCHRIVYDPLGDDVPIRTTIVFQFSKSRLKRLLQKFPRNMKDDGAVDNDDLIDVI